jgi:putative ABC transport system permease protein
MHSFLSMLKVDLGFNPNNIIAVRAPVSNGTQSQQRQFIDSAVARLGSLPGVVAAGATSGFPVYGGSRTQLDVVGKIHTQEWLGAFAGCDPQYFSTIGYRFLRGRPFSASDVTNARKVAVINQTLVNRYFGDRNPLGQHVRIGRLQAASEKASEPVFEIIGVVADVRNRGLEEPTVPEVFIPATSSGVVPSTILIRTSADSRKLLDTVRNELRALNTNGRVPDLDTLDGLMGRYSYARPRFSVFLMAAFAGVGLVLVAAGIYGVMSYAVSQRTREIGIRIALGADRAQVFGEVFAGALRLIGFGLFAGLMGSVLTNRLIAGQVWTITPFDPVILLGSVAVILILGFAACYVPALRATRVQPIISLRYD